MVNVHFGVGVSKNVLLLTLVFVAVFMAIFPGQGRRPSELFLAGEGELWKIGSWWCLWFIRVCDWDHRGAIFFDEFHWNHG